MNIDIEKIRQSDIKEFERLYRQYCERLILFANKYVYDLSTAQDLVQDVFLSIWMNRKNLDSSKSIKTYLYAAVRNKALNILKHARIDRHYKEKILIQNEYTNNAEMQVISKELENSVNLAIQNLPEKCRIIFLLSRNDHLTHAEIASVLGLSRKTIENQIGKALKILYKFLFKSD